MYKDGIVSAEKTHREHIDLLQKAIRRMGRRIMYLTTVDKESVSCLTCGNMGQLSNGDECPHCEGIGRVFPDNGNWRHGSII